MFNFSKIKILSKDDLVDDLYICALGFEDRCLSAVMKLENYKYKCNNAIIINYDVHQKENNKNKAKLERTLKKICKNIFYVLYNVIDPLNSEKNFYNILKEIKPSGILINCSIDITSFSSASLIHILEMMSHVPNYKIDRLKILYTEAKIYYPLKKDSNKKIPENIYLSSGIREVVVVPSLSGLVYPGYSTLLIIFLGFDPIRARGAIKFFQPSKKIGIIGVPPSSKMKWRINEVRNRNINLFEKSDELLKISTLDYRETIIKLTNLYNKFLSKSNFAICPLGSKMQTLGVFFFTKIHTEVKLIFPIPMQFHPSRYSKGFSNTWQVKFNNFSNLMNDITIKN